MNIAYLIPEFPSQTHAFFLREIKAMQKLGYEPMLISTQPPPASIQPHAWTDRVVSNTWYLHPINLSRILLVARGMAAARPSKWFAALSLVWGGRAVSWKRRLKNAAIAVYSLEMLGLARRHMWKHVHVHSCADAALVTLYMNALGGPSYSMTLHGPLEDYGGQQNAKWRHAAFCIIITRLLEQSARRALRDDFPEEVRVAPMGVDLNQFARRIAYQAWEPGQPVRLFSCARLNPVKGFEELIRAVRHVVDRGLDVRLRVAGQDELGGTGYAIKLKQLIVDLGLQQHIELLGTQSDERIQRELENAHLFVLASHHEPLGVAIMEAMAMGCPVVTTDAGGVSELVDDGVDGRLVKPRCSESLADVIEELLLDPVAATKLAENCRAKIEACFHSGVSAAAIAELIEGLCSDRVVSDD